MPKFEIVYFSGCPLVPRAREALRDAGISSFSEINQDKLEAGSELKRLSSPSILVDGRVIAGSKNSPGACSIEDWKSITEVLRVITRS